MVVGVGGSVGPLDMTALDLSGLWDGTVTARSDTMMTVDEGSGFIAHFSGLAVTYDADGHPTAGTITAISEDHLGQTTFSLTELNVSATQFYQWVSTNDNESALRIVLAGNDTLTGTAFNDHLIGLGGHDFLVGGAGDDLLEGGDGNDHLYGRSSSGGPDGADWLYGGNGSDYLQGNAGNDILDGQDGSDRMLGGSGNDFINGESGNDTINGNLGDDMITGDEGNDSLRGGQGNDNIDAGFGDDFLSGDKGYDRLRGSAGADTFHFAPGDAPDPISSSEREVITDFTRGVDHLQIGFVPVALVTSNSVYSIMDILARGQAVLDSHPGDHEVAMVDDHDGIYLMWDSSGGNTADSVVFLDYVTTAMLSVSDFI